MKRYNLSLQGVTPLATLLRTISLVSLTLLMVVAVRFCSPARSMVQRLVAAEIWPRLYGVFHIETALGREQILLVAIITGCFVLALIMQILFLFIKDVCLAKSSARHN
ncbi:hypothetical protein PT277_06925 [Acetobacteraceae bacterium ESL0709]|nr:hypothetical protein [Acetobacteraceae bacterium ESL0697]MDF7678425.1 hypothetical protein [Acetobacteraceae bacterium ESL0709]